MPKHIAVIIDVVVFVVALPLRILVSSSSCHRRGCHLSRCHCVHGVTIVLGSMFSCQHAARGCHIVIVVVVVCVRDVVALPVSFPAHVPRLEFARSK